MLFKLFNSGKLIIATSMGIDSISLAWKIANNPSFKDRYHLIHIHHHYIKEDDDICDRFNAFITKYDLPGTVYHSSKKPNGESPEAFCHDVRQELYKQALEDIDPVGNILTAHTLDDACESYLMNCLKGEQCYCPIKPISVLDKGQIVRPAILYTKKELSENIPKEIKEYEYVDPLNSSTLSQRNWIRNKIIPTIEEKYKGLPKVVKKKILKYIEENYV